MLNLRLQISMLISYKANSLDSAKTAKYESRVGCLTQCETHDDYPQRFSLVEFVVESHGERQALAGS